MCEENDLRFSSLDGFGLRQRRFTLLYKQIEHGDGDDIVEREAEGLVREGNGGEPKPEEIAKRGVGGVHRGLVTHEDVDGNCGGGQSGAEKRQGVQSGEDG